LACVQHPGLAFAIALSLLGCSTAVEMEPVSGPSASADVLTSAEAVVAAQLKAYNDRDIDAFMATMHPDVELLAIDDTTPRASGAEAVREVYAALFEKSPDLHSELVHRAVIGNRIVDHERITGRQGGGVLELVMVYEVEDGGIRRAWSIR
jgi:hypothetical protein